MEKIKDEVIETTEETQPEIEETQPEIGEEAREKTFTQSELDRIVKNRLERAMKKAEEERAKKVEQAEELAKLSEKERAKKEIELKEKELEEERKEFYRERLELQTTKELDKLELPIAFTEFVIGKDDETTFERIKQFHELWETELEKRRIESMKGKTPTMGGKSVGITKEQFKKMKYKEQLALKNENVDLYNELVKQ